MERSLQLGSEENLKMLNGSHLYSSEINLSKSRRAIEKWMEKSEQKEKKKMKYLEEFPGQ
jgi:hypothetical protein